MRKIIFNLISGETETTRINHIIETGAKNRLTDLQFLQREILEWRNSVERQWQITGERYYGGDHDIILRKRTTIDEDGNLREVKNLPNNRSVDNQYARMVNQKVNYSFAKPFSFDTKNKTYAKILRKLFNSRWDITLKNIAEDSFNGGIGWLYVYYNQAGELNFKRFESYEIRPLWQDSEHTRLDAVLRLYEVVLYDGNSPSIQEHVEVYTKEGKYNYLLKSGILTPEEVAFEPYLTVGDKNFTWSTIPIIPFKRNSKEQPLIKAVKSLQDGINLMHSTFENNLEEDPRNSIMVLVNYDGENLGEFRQKLATYGAVKVVNTDDRPGGDVRTLSVDVNCENYKAIVDIFKKALIENAQGYDAKDDRMSGNPNQMNIMSMYSDIDIDATGIESEFRASMEQLLWFINAHLKNSGQGDYSHEDIRIIFNRNVLMNNAELIDQCQKSEGQISRKTILSKHPFVEDVDAELEQLKKEQQEVQEDLYSNAFAKQSEHEGLTDEQ